MRTIEGGTGVEVPGAAESPTAIRKAGAVRYPSIDIACVDDAVDFHLMAKIADLWPPPENVEEDDDLAEALRSALRVAIKEALTYHKVSVVDALPLSSAVAVHGAERSPGAPQLRPPLSSG